MLDRGKVHGQGEALALGASFVLVVASFVFSALYALYSLTRRKWSSAMPEPGWLPPKAHTAFQSLEEQLGDLAAATLNSFGFNWEISDLKNRLVDRALWFLVAALLGLLLIAVEILIIDIRLPS